MFQIFNLCQTKSQSLSFNASARFNLIKLWSPMAAPSTRELVVLTAPGDGQVRRPRQRLLTFLKTLEILMGSLAKRSLVLVWSHCAAAMLLVPRLISTVIMGGAVLCPAGSTFSYSNALTSNVIFEHSRRWSRVSNFEGNVIWKLSSGSAVLAYWHIWPHSVLSSYSSCACHFLSSALRDYLWERLGVVLNGLYDQGLRTTRLHFSGEWDSVLSFS